MYKLVELRLSPEDACDDTTVLQSLAKSCNITTSDITGHYLIRRSIDARQRHIKLQLQYGVFINEEPKPPQREIPIYNMVQNAPSVIIVGCGPAGLFCALRLIELGLKPIIVERGADVSNRKIHIANLQRSGELNPNSNYAFGEGGAGTFSDGKLFTRSTKRGNVHRILSIFVNHGANDEILIDTHPHIGTDMLPNIIRNMRETIINHGGEVHFDSKMDDILIDNNNVKGIKLSDGTIIESNYVVLSTGHSANDVYHLLSKLNVALEAKSWAMGVRVEHPQQLIDQIQYHSHDGRGKYLPAATYSLVTQVDNRGCYSFCMCPGGFIVPSMTDNDTLVVNGMSPSNRNSHYANSGIVVEVRPEDIAPNYTPDAIGCLSYRTDVERLAFTYSKPGFQSPAQRLTDFIESKPSQSLPRCSYLPGIVPSPMDYWLPTHISKRLQRAFRNFDKSMHGFLTNEAIVVGLESRTSSPVRILRDKITYESVSTKGLFPCGEGAGYAGGIVSSSIDGELTAESIARIATHVIK